MIEIQLFGNARHHDRVHGVGRAGYGGRKPQQVLWLLALNGDRTLPKARLAEQLWEGEPPASWLSTLEGYVSLLRRALRGGPDQCPAVVTSPGGYRLDLDRVAVDVCRFDALVAAAGATADTAADCLRQALGLAIGPVLDGEVERSWILDARTRYEERVCAAATAAARFALDAGDLTASIGYGKWACELDPFAEDAWHTVIAGQWRSGRRAQALRSFEQVQTLLDTHLRVRPNRALQELYLDVLRDELAPALLAG